MNVYGKRQYAELDPDGDYDVKELCAKRVCVKDSSGNELYAIPTTAPTLPGQVLTYTGAADAEWKDPQLPPTGSVVQENEVLDMLYDQLPSFGVVFPASLNQWVHTADASSFPALDLPGGGRALYISYNSNNDPAVWNHAVDDFSWCYWIVTMPAAPISGDRDSYVIEFLARIGGDNPMRGPAAGTNGFRVTIAPSSDGPPVNGSNNTINSRVIGQPTPTMPLNSAVNQYSGYQMYRLEFDPTPWYGQQVHIAFCWESGTAGANMAPWSVCISERLKLLRRVVSAATISGTNLTVSGTIQASNMDTLGFTSGYVYCDDVQTDTLTMGNVPNRYTLPPATGTLNQILRLDGNDDLQWTSQPAFDGGIIVGTGGSVQWPNFNFIRQDGTDLAIEAGTSNLRLDPTTSVRIGSGATDYSLPITRGAAGEVLQIDGSGAMNWAAGSLLSGKKQSTGLFVGGTLSVNADDTKFDISDGNGQVVDSVTGTVTPVSWSGLTAQSAAYSGVLTYVSISSVGAVVTSATKPTNADHRTNIQLGVLVHVNAVNIDAVNQEQSPIHQSTNQLVDLINAIGFINVSGNVPQPVTLLKFKKTAGEMFFHGINFVNDIDNPHLLTLPLVDTGSGGTFQYRYQDGSSSLLTLTDIIPSEYDDGNGQATPGTVTSNRWQVQRFYSFTSNAVKIQPGQATYSTKADALAAIQTEVFITEPSIRDNGMLIGYLAVRGGATDLSLSNDAMFVAAGKFGSGSGGGGLGGGYTGSSFNDGIKIAASYVPSAGGIVNGTWYPLEASGANWKINATQTDWTYSAPTATRTLYTYTGPTRKFLVNTSITVWMEAGSGSCFLNFAAFVNGAEMANAVCQAGARADDDATTWPSCISGTGIYTFNTNDTLELYLQPLLTQAQRIRVYQCDYSVTAVE